ncbi:MAG: pyrimidine/purine nucleoside phosphorylase [Peptococcaceae bacterium]|nr:pyrimidine/purine nucleoside phosphorylase [Peptococcaceae bacterium]
MQHSVYFDGKVQSLELNSQQGRATVGVMTPGKYTFSTASEERMVITSGRLKVKLPCADWIEFSAKEEFVVPEKSSFDVAADMDVSYICYYK